MTVYHGSDTIVDIPRILEIKRPLDFICVNRQGLNMGDIDKELALKRLKTEKLCDQILFHTEKSLEFLHYIETEVTEE